LVQFHIDNQALATLAVQDRKKPPAILLFDDSTSALRSPRRKRRNGIGWRSEPMHALAFFGIHVILSTVSADE